MLRAADSLLSWAALAVLTSPALAMDVNLSPQSVTVGDPVVVLLDTPLAADGSPPQLPSDFESWGTAEVVNAERVTPLATKADPGAAEAEAFDASASARYRIELRAFRPGRVDLPPITLEIAPSVEVGEEDGQLVQLTTPEGLGFHVESVLPQDLPEGETIEPKPMAPLRSLQRRHLDRWLLGGVALILALAGFLYWRRRSQGDATSGRSQVPPFEAFRRELERLESLDATETVHVDLSLALRHYLQDAAGLPAPERTTVEIQRALRASVLSAEVERPLVRLLRQCDSVKFARLEVSSDETLRRLAGARRLGETIEGELATLLASADEVAA